MKEKKLYTLTLKLDKTNEEIGVIAIPNQDEETVKRAINKLAGGERHLKMFCEQFTYEFYYGSYFDKVRWETISYDIVEIMTL